MSGAPQDRGADPTGGEQDLFDGTGGEQDFFDGTGAEETTAEEAPSARPGDAARRALRAARATHETGETRRPSDTSGARAPRPGDAARAALRRSVGTRRSAGEPVDDEATGSDALTDTPDADTPDTADTAKARDTTPSSSQAPAAEAPSPHPRGSETPRPADIARDALRAARREQEQERERAAAARETTRTARPSRTPPSRAPLTAKREMAAFLANAFRMPPGTDDRAETDDAAPLSDEHPTPPPPGEDARAAGTRPPASPRAMDSRPLASPHRDSDLRRTFPAFPPRPSSDDTRFAETWWGNAWITALEEGALDAKRLVRGRGYAEQGHVDAITVTPGLVLAYVHGSRPRPYRVQIRLRTLEDADWERFLDAAADRPGHIAALLDKEMPHALAEGDVPLLPGPGDLEPRCSCPDRGHPCKHAAALCYQTARLLDADPFVLLLLRGRGERELLDALSRLNATRAARAAQERDPAPLPGVRATDALATRRLPPLPPPLPVPSHPEQPPAYPAAPGGPDPLALDQLATDAAARAHTLLTTGHDPVAELTLWQDAVRLAAARPGAGLTAATRGLYASLASAAGRTPAELARAVAAWRQGGPDGLAVLEEPWDPPAGRFDRARPLLLAADLPAFRPWRNRLTHPRGHIQLRLGRDGLWYAYESEPGADDWWPRGTPDPDPVGALTGLGGPTDP
ncbi:SWIM zinc finger family protein [Streptomyces sp. NPDC052676]|uniref:SWIM zinc finger family protein n=1 Tax=Streptomyces sp. NPDC052676 TaxID=3154953 RepID=UPI0034372DE9